MQNTNSFYRLNMPRGQAFIMTKSWVSGSTPIITIDPEAGEELFIEEIGMYCSLPFTLPTGKNIIFNGLYESDGTTDFEIHTTDELKALLDNLIIETNEMAGKLKIHPPLKLTDSGIETLIIQHTDGAGGTIDAGTITFVIKGWRLAESDD